MTRKAVVAGSVAIAIVAAAGISYTLARYGIVFMRSLAMEPAIRSGTMLVVDRFAYRGAAPRRGDVIAFSGVVPFMPLIIERVAAVPGDRFAVRGGRAYVNGRPLDDARFSRAGYALSIHDGDIWVDGNSIAQPVASGVDTNDRKARETVPPGCYLVLGDQRDRSIDSHVFGFLCPDRPGLWHPDEPAHLVGRVIHD
jgi:signal peptidase I